MIRKCNGAKVRAITTTVIEDGSDNCMTMWSKCPNIYLVVDGNYRKNFDYIIDLPESNSFMRGISSTLDHYSNVEL